MISEKDYKESLSKISEAIALYGEIDTQQWELASLHTKLENRQIFRQPKNVSIFRCAVSVILLIASVIAVVVVYTKVEYENKTQDLVYCSALLVLMLANTVYLIVKRATYEKRRNDFSQKLTSSKLAAKTAECESRLAAAKLSFDRICEELGIPSYFRDISSLSSFQDDFKNKYYFHGCSNVGEWSKKRFDDILLRERRERERKESEYTKALADEFDAKERIGDHIIDGPSIWYDYRTGERLKQTTEGKIVNSEGEEVSPAWWD